MPWLVCQNGKSSQSETPVGMTVVVAPARGIGGRVLLPAAPGRERAIGREVNTG
jgi:hypothetical protein